MSFKLNVSHKFIIIWLSLGAFLHNILMNGANNVILSSLQKEFYLSSQETGVYIGVYDIGSLVSSVLVSYLSARGSKPRWIAFGLVMLFIGCTINTLPHFLKPYELVIPIPTNNTNSDVSIELCKSSNNSDQNKNIFNLKKDTGFKFQLKHLLYAANIINGLSSASMTTITFSYIEDIVPAKLASIYESVYFAVGAFGVGVGFVITSNFLKIHTDLDRAGNLPSWLTPSHPNWIGAWWLPFLIFGFVALIMASVLFFFPSKLKHDQSEDLKKKEDNELDDLNPNSDKEEINRLKSKENQSMDAYKETGSLLSFDNKNLKDFNKSESDKENQLMETFKEIGSLLSLNNIDTGLSIDPSNLDDLNKSELKNELTLVQKSIKLFKNPVYIFIIIAAALEGALQNSILAFSSMFVEYQYRLPSGSSSLTIGLLSLPPLIIGGLCSGFIVNKLKTTRNCFKFLAFVLFVNIFFYIGFAIYCKEPTPLTNNNQTSLSECNCDDKVFKPVCLINSKDVFSQTACLAGCSSFEKESSYYMNCTHVEDSYKVSNTSNDYYLDGLCPRDSSCTLGLVLTYLSIFVLFLLNALIFLPYLKVTIGCIDSKEMNSIGLGMKQFFMNAFGTIPGPIFFGYVFDSACIYWHEDSNGQRMCKMYDNKRFALSFCLLGVSFKSACFLLVILSLIFLKKQKK